MDCHPLQFSLEEGDTLAIALEISKIMTIVSYIECFKSIKYENWFVRVKKNNFVSLHSWFRDGVCKSFK